MGSIHGARIISGLWRIYPFSAAAKRQLFFFFLIVRAGATPRNKQTTLDWLKAGSQRSIDTCRSLATKGNCVSTRQSAQLS